MTKEKKQWEVPEIITYTEDEIMESYRTCADNCFRYLCT